MPSRSMYVPAAVWLVRRRALIGFKLVTGCAALLLYNYVLTV